MTTRREFLESMAAVSIAATSVQVTQAETASTSTAPAQRHRGVVQTVLGPIEASKLGFTLPHEHICCTSAGFWKVWPEYFGGRANFIAKTIDKLKAAKAEGVDTIVDVTPFDVGRDVRLLEEVSRKSGVQIVACTGHWLDPQLSMSSRTVEELTDFFILEIDRGIEDTGIKPGVIKVATGQEGVTPFLDKVLRAAARASKATGTPITTHTYALARIGEKQADIFEAEGVDPRSVCLGHCDESNDMDYRTGLIKRGYTIGMDHFVWGFMGQGLTWQKRAECLKNLIDAGFAGKLFLSNEWVLGMSVYGTEVMQSMEKTNQDGLLFTLHKTIPYLGSLGVTKETIDTITVQNPRRFFGTVT